MAQQKDPPHSFEFERGAPIKEVMTLVDFLQERRRVENQIDELIQAFLKKAELRPEQIKLSWSQWSVQGPSGPAIPGGYGAAVMVTL